MISMLYPNNCHGIHNCRIYGRLSKMILPSNRKASLARARAVIVQIPNRAKGRPPRSFRATVLAYPTVHRVQLRLSGHPHRIRIVFVRGAQIQMVGTVRNDHNRDTIVGRPQNAAAAPRIEQTIAEDDVRCGTVKSNDKNNTLSVNQVWSQQGALSPQLTPNSVRRTS